MKFSNFSKISPIKKNEKSKISKSIINSPYIIEGEINKQKIIYDQKYSLKNFIPIKDEKNEIKIIGSGSFGNVYLSKNIVDKKIYAIKHMEKIKLLKILHSLKGIYNEIEIQSRISHENIIKILYTHEDKENFDLIMEYAENGNLFHYIRKKNGLNELQSFQLFIQVVNAVNFLHKNDLIHRDIKPENILLFNPNKNSHNIYLVKLCDFGWCVKINKDETRKTFCGTTEYMSPELIEHKGYSKEIDVWSLGILLYEMIHGYSPFRPKKKKFEEKEVFDNIKKHNIKFGKKISIRCKKLIYNLLDMNKNKRFKVEDIYNSDFVKYYEKNRIYIPLINEDIFDKNEYNKNNNNVINKNCICNNKIKKFNNSFVNKIPNDIYSMFVTKRNSRNKYEKINHSFDKDNIYSFINNIDKKDNRNKRNKNINKINIINSNSRINLNTEKIYFTKKLNNTNTSFEKTYKQKSITNLNSAKNSFYKIKNNKHYKKENENDTIKSDLFSQNFIKYIIKDFQSNNTNNIRKTPEIRNILFDTQIKESKEKNKNKLELGSSKEKQEKNNFKEIKIFNINLPQKINKNKNRIKYLTERNSKSKSKNKEKINNTNQRKKLNDIRIKKKQYNKNISAKSEKIYINKINNINYQNNNIKNFYIINNTNINKIENDYINKKEILFENYLKKVKINEKNINNNKESEISMTPKKNKDNTKINPIKLLGDFKKEYNHFHIINNDEKK